tara:strand:+ start:416 stop:625 length:210 start_codon:yes stop_codon:yes gene_type:complete
MTNKTASPAHEQIGHCFAPWKTSVTSARQAAYHQPTGIDSARFGGTVDVSVLKADGKPTIQVKVHHASW